MAEAQSDGLAHDAGSMQVLAGLQTHLLDHPDDTDALADAADILFEMGSYGQAAAHLRKALDCAGQLAEIGSGSPAEDDTAVSYEALQRLGDCHGARGHVAQAARYYVAAAALAPAHPDPYVSLGALALQNRQLAQAQDYFRAACSIQQDCGQAYSGLAMVCQQRQDYAGAFEMYLKCLECDGDNLVALLGLFETSCQMGSFEGIIHYLQVYLQRHPHDGSVLFCLASLYAREGRLVEARAALADVLCLQPDKAEALALLAELSKRGAVYPEA